MADPSDKAYDHQQQQYDAKGEREDHSSASPGTGSDAEEAAVGTVGVGERALLRKIDFRLLPAVGILYLLSFLDRSNVANARIEGLADDLGMSEWAVCSS